jgi:cell division protein FtsN
MAVTQKMPELKSGNLTAPVQQLDKEYKILIRSSLSRLTSTKRRKSSLPVEDNRLPKVTHSVQVGAFLAKENADVRVAKLTERGYKPKIVVFNDSMGRRWYTVRIGNYASREIAQKIAKAFSKREKFESAIVPVDAL